MEAVMHSLFIFNLTTFRTSDQQMHMTILLIQIWVKTEGISCELHCSTFTEVALCLIWPAYFTGRANASRCGISFDGDSPEDWCLNGILPQRRSISEHNGERNTERDLIRRFCVIIPAPLYSRGSWLKDSQGYGLFFSLHLLIIPSFLCLMFPSMLSEQIPCPCPPNRITSQGIVHSW